MDLRCNKNVTPVKENQGSVFSVIGSRLLSGEGGGAFGGLVLGDILRREVSLGGKFG